MIKRNQFKDKSKKINKQLLPAQTGKKQSFLMTYDKFKVQHLLFTITFETKKQTIVKLKC
jgi:hypothetical protein